MRKVRLRMPSGRALRSAKLRAGVALACAGALAGVVASASSSAATPSANAHAAASLASVVAQAKAAVQKGYGTGLVQAPPGLAAQPEPGGAPGRRGQQRHRERRVEPQATRFAARDGIGQVHGRGWAVLGSIDGAIRGRSGAMGVRLWVADVAAGV